MATSSSKNFFAWQRYIYNDFPKLPKDVERIKLMAFCQALAFHGRMGMTLMRRCLPDASSESLS